MPAKCNLWLSFQTDISRTILYVFILLIESIFCFVFHDKWFKLKQKAYKMAGEIT